MPSSIIGLRYLVLKMMWRNILVSDCGIAIRFSFTQFRLRIRVDVFVILYKARKFDIFNRVNRSRKTRWSHFKPWKGSISQHRATPCVLRTHEINSLKGIHPRPRMKKTKYISAMSTKIRVVSSQDLDCSIPGRGCNPFRVWDWRVLRNTGRCPALRDETLSG